MLVLKLKFSRSSGWEDSPEVFTCHCHWSVASRSVVICMEGFIMLNLGPASVAAAVTGVCMHGTAAFIAIPEALVGWRQTLEDGVAVTGSRVSRRVSTCSGGVEAQNHQQ